MFKILIYIFANEIILSCSIGEHSNSSEFKIIQTNYSKIPEPTSNLPRSKYSSERYNFTWNDYMIEIEEFQQRYPPIVDFGTGKPNYLPAQEMLNELAKLTANQTEFNSWQTHQYARSRGDIQLVNIVAKFFSPLLNRNLDPLNEVLITVGSMQGLDLFARAYINPGDEVLVFEPFYAYYHNHIKLSGGKMVTIPFTIKNGTTGQSTDDLSFDKLELESKINNKTKIVLLNNPNNPIGKIFTLDELTYIGSIAEKYDLLILSDEAGQWHIYDESVHVRIASLPGLFKRTITLTSGGKMFSNSGWRIGWAIAPGNLLRPMSAILAINVLSVSTSMQIAFAKGMENELQKLGTPQSYFVNLKVNGEKARNRLVSILRSVGANVINPAGGYCILANFTKLANQIDLSNQTDNRPGMRFWKYMLIEKGLAAYPQSMFYSPENMWKTEYVLRFTNLKTIESLNDLEKLLTKVFKRID